MNSVFAMSTYSLQGRADLRRIGGVEHVQPREAGLLCGRSCASTSGRGSSRPCRARRASVKFCGLHALREILVGRRQLARLALVSQPEPFALVIAGPDRLVLVPEPADLGGGAPFRAVLELDRLLDAGAHARASGGRCRHRARWRARRAHRAVDSRLSAASANSLTPSLTSSAVIASSEMPNFSSSASTLRRASSTFDGRGCRGPCRGRGRRRAWPAARC
jgi:hypothetical protein